MNKPRQLLLAALVGVLTSCPILADSLAETGGYVPVDAPVLAFKGITLAHLGTTVFPSVSKGGAWAGGSARVPLFCRAETRNGDAPASVSYQAQWIDGSYLKCVTIEFTNGDGGVYAQLTSAKATDANLAQNYCTDFTGSTSASPVSAADGQGYGLHSLALHTVADIDSININFNDTEATKVSPGATSAAIGPSTYAVVPYGWSQMLGTNNNTLNGVTAVGDDGEFFYASVSANVTITGTRGTWAYSGYTAASDVRYGYIDEDANNTTPTVTVTNIPFDYYKVVFIPSTDTGDSKFGYITVNGKNYSSADTTLASDKEYDIVADSTDAWGKTQVADYLHGVNYLVTPVHANNGGKTLTVTGHKSGGRGCIAAIQIVKAEAPDTIYSVTATGNVTWSTKDGLTVNSGTWASGNSIILVNNQASPVTVTFDEAVNASDLMLSGSGTTIIKFSDSAYNQIAAFNFNGVTGEVVLDDYMQTVAFAPPATGAVRYQGTGTLTAVPCASGAIPYTVIVDQPLTVSEFQLAGVKNDYRFGESFVGTFASCFVLGNNNGSNQSVTQMGGSITVNGESENYNQSSILLGHWGSLTVNLNTYGGTFTAPNAAVRLGHTGKCYWTIGDGESADDSTAVANLKGIRNTNGASDNGGSGSKVVLQQGGTLNLGESGVDIPNATFTLAGGKLVTTADTAVSIAAGTVTSEAGTDTEINTANGLEVASSVGGAGSVTKTGSGTLTLSASAASTGTLAVDAGTVKLGEGVTWAGTISVGADGTLDITDADASESETVYIPVGGTLALAEGATVKLNGAAINTEVWELSGGTFVNKTLKTAVTTATGDFAFSTATWESALGAGAEIDWSRSLSEVRVHANNSAPATATIDVNAAHVEAFVKDGAGEMAFVRTGTGGITASAYDFTSGTTTLVGPWGTVDGDVGTLDGTVSLGETSTLVFAPGEGKSQKLTSRLASSVASSTVVISNGTFVANVYNDDGKGTFQDTPVVIEKDGILSLEENSDTLGWNATASLTINEGGVLQVKKRDTLRRTVTLNGGTITVEGAHSGRGLDFYGLVMNVLDDSSIDQLEEQSKIGMRRGTTVINLNDGKTLSINANLYPELNGIGLTVRAAAGQGNQNGVVQLNGYSESPKQTFDGTVTVGEANKAAILALNCEHENGVYVVNAASRFKGTGSVTGNGGVTLAASNAKLCGSLMVNNLTAASGGTYGDQWDSVAAKVSTSYFAAGTQTVENGSFAIGAGCVVTNAAGTADHTDATFSIAANGNLKIERSLTVAGLTVADGGTITLVGSKVDMPALNVAGSASYAGEVVFVLDFGTSTVPAVRTITLLTGENLPEAANVTVVDSKRQKKWKVQKADGSLTATSNGGFGLLLR